MSLPTDPAPIDALEAGPRVEHRAIDAIEPEPPQVGVDHNYITRDIASALERAVRAWVERVALERKCGHRRAATIVLNAILHRLNGGGA